MKFWVTILAIAVSYAQTPATPAKSVVGEVASIDAAARQIKLKADNTGAVYTVVLEDKTSYLRVPLGEKDIKKATKITLADIAAGDRMAARGPVSEDTKTVPASTVIVMTKADIAQKQQQDRAEWQKRGIAGVVTAVNPDAKEVTVTTRGRDSRTITIDASGNPDIRRYAPDSVKYSDAKPSSLAELHAGDNLRALGDKNDDGSRFKAQEIIFGSFQTIAATVISVDAANGTLRLMDLQTKKPVTVKTNAETVLKRLPGQMAQGLAMRMRGGAAADGRPGGAATPASGGPVGTGGPGAPGGPAGSGGRGGNIDFAQMLERMPALSLSELKPGDALIVASSKEPDPSNITAMTLVAGVEPFLAAAPRTAGQINLGSWNLEGGIPEQ